MIKFSSNLAFFLLIFFSNLRNGQCLLQCYLCTDCSDPFSETQPYTSIVTNQNYGASCIKTISTVSYGKVVSRGTTFNCNPTSTTDIRVYCCQSNLCNGSNVLKQFGSFFIFSIFYTMYLFIH